MQESEKLLSANKMRKKFSLDSAVARHVHSKACVKHVCRKHEHSQGSEKQDVSKHGHSKNSEKHDVSNLEHSRSSQDSVPELKNAKHSAQNARVRSISFDSAGLVLPRKLVNPCMQSMVVKEINREIKWTNRK